MKTHKVRPYLVANIIELLDLKEEEEMQEESAMKDVSLEVRPYSLYIYSLYYIVHIIYTVYTHAPFVVFLHGAFFVDIRKICVEEKSIIPKKNTICKT